MEAVVREYQKLGHGSLRKRLSRGRWEAVANYREATAESFLSGAPEWGPWKQTSLLLDVKCWRKGTRGKAQAEALKNEWYETLLAETEEAQARLLSPHPAPSDLTTAECVASHIEARPKEKKMDASTIRRYKERAKCIEDHAIANVLVTELTKADVEHLRDDLLEEYAPVTVRDIIRLLKAALKRAVDDEVIVKSPAERVTVACPRFWEPNYLPEEEYKTLLHDLGDVTGRRNCMSTYATKLALFTGMREGEICALRFRDIDTKAYVIHVRKAIGRGEKNAYYLKDPKSVCSRRDIPMTPAIERAIASARKLHEDAGERIGPNTFVFGCGETFLDPKVLYRNFKRRVKRLGLEGSTEKALNFHSLRHTFATHAIKRGVDVRSVASILGHSDVSVTLNLYASSDPKAKQAAMYLIAECFEEDDEFMVDETEKLAA